MAAKPQTLDMQRPKLRTPWYLSDLLRCQLRPEAQRDEGVPAGVRLGPLEEAEESGLGPCWSASCDCTRSLRGPQAHWGPRWQGLLSPDPPSQAGDGALGLDRGARVRGWAPRAAGPRTRPRHGAGTGTALWSGSCLPCGTSTDHESGRPRLPRDLPPLAPTQTPTPAREAPAPAPAEPGALSHGGHLRAGPRPP